MILDEHWNEEAQSSWYAFFSYIGAHLLKNSLEFDWVGEILRLRVQGWKFKYMARFSSMLKAMFKSDDGILRDLPLRG